MSNQVGGSEWGTAALVGLFGGMGGLTAWVWSITVGTPMDLDTPIAISANALLGVVAGFVGIYAIKIDPSRALMHSLALALLCGFAWKPTLEAGRELVITRVQEGEVDEQAEMAKRTVEAISEASAETAPFLIDELESVLQELMSAGDSVRDPALRAKVDRVVVESTEALIKAAEIAPEEGARALGSIGAAAFREGRGAISNVAAGTLVRLAEEKEFEVGTASEVSNSLLRLSAAARAGQREDRAAALREQSRMVFERAEELLEDEPERAEELRERSIAARELPPRTRRRPPNNP